MLKAKYKVRNNWLSLLYSGKASPSLKSLMGIRHLVVKVACFQVGNSASIRIWSDPWIPNLPGFIPSPKEGANANLALVVSQLLTSEHRIWDMAKLNYFFEEPVVELILSIPIPVFQKEDCLAWIASNSGLFSVKFAYWLSRVESPPSNINAVRGQIWKTKIHEHFKMLLWRIAANLLPSKEIISRFNESMDLSCHLCSSAVETTLHLFTVCPFSKSLWYQSEWGLRMEVLNFDSPSKFVNFKHFT